MAEEKVTDVLQPDYDQSVESVLNDNGDTEVTEAEKKPAAKKASS